MPPQKKGNNSKGKKLTEFRFNVDIRTLFIIIFIGFFLLFAFQSLSKAAKQVMPEKSITTVVKEAKAGKVKKVEIIDNKILVYYNDEKLAIAYKETGESFLKTLKDNNVNLDKVNLVVKDTQGSAGWVNFLANIIPTILMVAFFIFLFRQAKGAQESVFSFGQSRAKRFSKDLPKITFRNVAGIDEAKKEMEEIVDFLKHPEKYKKLGARTPKGVILVGPSGCGKTLLAKAVAGEANVPFFSIAGSEFMEMLVGIGAARVRDLFANAKKSAPSIIFIVDFPDVEGRKAIIKIHAKGKPFDESVNWDRVARRTVGYSGADLENMLNEAAISAARVARQKNH